MYLWYIIENVHNTFETSLPSKTKYIIYISALCHLIKKIKSHTECFKKDTQRVIKFVLSTV